MSKFEVGDAVRIVADRNGLLVGSEAVVTDVFDWWVHLRARNPGDLNAIGERARYAKFIYLDKELAHD